jgi:hypothetical protein
MLGIAQRAEGNPLDLVHLPPAPWVGPQPDSDDIRNILASRGGGVFAASSPWTAIEGVHSASEPCGKAFDQPDSWASR